MKIINRIAFAFILGASLTLSACNTPLGNLVTGTVTNPIRSVDIYRAKNLYAGTLQLVVDYRQFCWAKPYAALMADPVTKAVCQNRRAVVRAVQTQRPTVAKAIKFAEDFVANNPTVDATAVIATAYKAASDFRGLIPAFPGS